MALAAKAIAAPEPAPQRDRLAQALCAAELGELCETARLTTAELREFFAAVPSLRAVVPFATARLLSRLAGDHRPEVRAQAHRLLAPRRAG